jgi:hypothetical protein
MQFRSLASLGLVVAFAACNNSAQGVGDGGVSSTMGAIHGTVTLNGATTGDSGVIITLSGSTVVVATDDGGNYFLGGLAPGNYTVGAQKSGFAPGSAAAMVVAGQVAEAPPINLLPAGPSGMGTVTGNVTLFDATKHDGTMIALMPGMLTATSDVMGNYTFMNVPAGTYDAVFTHAGYDSQTVHDIIVSNGTFTVGHVTLRRAARVSGGHTIVSFGPAPSGESRDLTKVLVGIDGQIFVVPQATGTPILVSAGTSAAGAAFSPDGNRVSLTFTAPPPSFFAPPPPTSLWLGPSDGSAAPVLVSSNVDSGQTLAIWSPNSSHLWFNTTAFTSGALTVNDWYSVPSSGANAVKVVTGGQLFQATPDLKQILFAFNFRTVGGTNVADVALLDTNAGTVSTIMTQILASEISAITTVFMTGPLVLTSQTSTTGTAVGDLYLFRAGDAAATKLTTTPIDSAAVIDQTTSTGHVFVTARNADTTLALYAFDTAPAAPTLRTLVPSSPVTTQTAVLLEPFNNYVYAGGAKQLSLSRNGANMDLYNVDVTNATSAVIAASVTRFGSAAITPGIMTNPGNPLTDYIRPLSATRVLFATGSTGVVFDAHLWDGANAHVIETGVGRVVAITFQLSLDGLTGAYFAPGRNPLTTAIIPAAAGAAVTHQLPTGTPVTPSVFNLAEDGTEVAYGGAGGTVNLIKSDGSAAAVLVTTDPNPAAVVRWLRLAPKNNAIVYGDNLNAPVNNTFITGVTAASASTGLGNLGTGSAIPFALAAGTRMFLLNQNTGDVGALDVPGGTALVPIALNADFNVLTMNPARTRLFVTGTDPASANPGLIAAGAAAAGSSGPIAGQWQLAALSPDGKSTFFLDTANNALAAYGETGPQIPLATTVDLAAGVQLFPNGTIAWIDQLNNTGPDNQLCASSLNAPARTVVVKGLAVTTFPATFTAAAGTSPWFSPDGAALYAFGDASAGTTSAPSFTLAAFQVSNATAAALGTNVVTNGGSTATSIQYDPTAANIVFASSFDSLAGSFKLSSAPVGTAVAATALSSGVVNWSFSPFSGVVVGGTNLVNGQANLFAGKLGAAAVSLGAIPSTAAQVFFTGDEKRVFSEDQGSGAAFYGKVGTAGLTEFDTGVIASGLFPDANGMTCVELAQHPGDPSFFVGRVTIQ